MMTRKDPIIFVIGCTGTGKSDLGVAIAKKYGGEVISVDSMQFYKGLDIATNKITTEEAEGVPHHMMSFLNPSDNSTYNVHDFKEATLDLIQQIRSRSKIPILVGGTTYYAESILYENNFIDSGKIQKSAEVGEKEVPKKEDKSEILEFDAHLGNGDDLICSQERKSLKRPRASSESSSGSSDAADDDPTISNEDLWEELKKVDEKSAMLIHPNNRSRVYRALQIYKDTGISKSHHVELQKSNESVDLPGRLRYDNSLVVYMDATSTVLDERLDGRVDKMIRMGLKKELIEFYNEHRFIIQKCKYGVMQCIGLKEFVPWLNLEASERDTEKGEKLFKQGCDDVKLHTRQYARRQRRWYRMRLLRRADGDRKMASTKMLDTSDKTRIISDGMEIVDHWMSGVDMYEEIPSGATLKGSDANVLLTCEICGCIMTGRDNWKSHISGKKHTSMLKKLREERKMAEQEAEN